MISEFKTISKASEPFLLKEKKSKFLGYALPIEKEQDLKDFIMELKLIYPNANHFCYAWSLGVDPETHRQNDDGEPNNTAGAPIYGQIKSYKLTNIAVVVVRIFGGVKLGTGGLISAYKAAAQGAIDQSNIVVKRVKKTYTLSCSYANVHQVMRIVKEYNATVVTQELGNECKVDLALSVSKSEGFEERVATFKDLKLI